MNPYEGNFLAERVGILTPVYLLPYHVFCSLRQIRINLVISTVSRLVCEELGFFMAITPEN